MTYKSSPTDLNLQDLNVMLQVASQPIVYVGAPYSKGSPEQKASLVALSDFVAAGMLDGGMTPLPPLSLYPRLEPAVRPNLASSHAFWMAHCLKMLARADMMAVVPVKGLWRESEGLQEEIDFAVRAQLKVAVWVGELPADSPLELEVPDPAEIIEKNWKIIGSEGDPVYKEYCARFLVHEKQFRDLQATPAANSTPH